MSKKLLLADDSVVIQKLVGLSFANEDIEIISTDNGDDAVRLAREAHPDVVLADVVMPGQSGYEVCESIKQDPALAGTPVLLLTGTFEAFDEARASAAGANGQVTKPFEAQALVERVNEVMAAAAAPPASANAKGTVAPPVSAESKLPPAAKTAPAAGDDLFDKGVSQLAASEATLDAPPALAVGGAAGNESTATGLFGAPGEGAADTLDTEGGNMALGHTMDGQPTDDSEPTIEVGPDGTLPPLSDRMPEPDPLEEIVEEGPVDPLPPARPLDIDEALSQAQLEEAPTIVAADQDENAVTSPAFTPEPAAPTAEPIGAFEDLTVHVPSSDIAQDGAMAPSPDYPDAAAASDAPIAAAAAAPDVADLDSALARPPSASKPAANVPPLVPETPVSTPPPVPTPVVATPPPARETPAVTPPPVPGAVEAPPPPVPGAVETTPPPVPTQAASTPRPVPEAPATPSSDPFGAQPAVSEAETTAVQPEKASVGEPLGSTDDPLGLAPANVVRKETDFAFDVSEQAPPTEGLDDSFSSLMDISESQILTETAAQPEIEHATPRPIEPAETFGAGFDVSTSDLATAPGEDTLSGERGLRIEPPTVSVEAASTELPMPEPEPPLEIRELPAARQPEAQPVAEAPVVDAEPASDTPVTGARDLFDGLATGSPLDELETDGAFDGPTPALDVDDDLLDIDADDDRSEYETAFASPASPAFATSGDDEANDTAEDEEIALDPAEEDASYAIGGADDDLGAADPPGGVASGRGDDDEDRRVADLSPMMEQRIQESLEKVAWEAFSDLSETIVKQVMGRVEQIAWEVIPEMAETLVREEIRRMKGDDD